MKNLTQKQEIGPYSDHPMVHIEYSGKYSGKNSLIRTIFEESIESEKEKEEMTLKKQILYFLFIYNPPKESEPKERKVLGREKLAERVTGFEVVKKRDGYYVKTSLS